MRHTTGQAIADAVRAAVAAHALSRGIDAEIAIDRLVIEVPHRDTTDGLAALIARSVVARVEALAGGPPARREGGE